MIKKKHHQKEYKSRTYGLVENQILAFRIVMDVCGNLQNGEATQRGE